MKNPAYLIPMLLVSACGSMQEVATVQDDVYDIPDRQALAAAALAEPPAEAPSAMDDYYNPSESRSARSADRDYYDMTYNDPYYYNYGRFGFGSGIGSYGRGYGMGLRYGWPTSFGSMSIGYGAGYGYDPYWNNSWMSGYGYDPYGYYGYGNYGYGYGGYGSGYGPYQGPWGGCYNCYEPSGYGNVVYSHRPSMSAGSAGAAGSSTAIAPRMMRNPASLLPDASPSRSPAVGTGRSIGTRPALENSRPTGTRPGRTTTPRTATPTRTPAMESRPSRTFDFGGGTSPSRPEGGNGGGGRTTSPRPR